MSDIDIKSGQVKFFNTSDVVWQDTADVLWESTSITVGISINATVTGAWWTNIAADPITIKVHQAQSVRSSYPVPTRDPALDTILNGNMVYDPFYDYAGVELTGEWLHKFIVADAIELTFTLSSDNDLTPPWNEDGLPITLTLTVSSSDTLFVGKSNWVKWSKIGSLDFTIGKDNTAGERPLDWAGWVYAIRKLGSKVVVYGQSGVSILSPHDVYWGMDTISRVGVLGKHAVCGTDGAHYFIDREYRLCKLTNAIELLDYSEYLDNLGANLVMSLDEVNSLIYICDGALGYVYSMRDGSLGKGPATITGIGSRNSSTYVTSSAAISTPVFSICTDVYDMGNRKNKTIHAIEVGTDLTTGLYAAIDYRNDKAAAFATTPWAPVNPNGIAVLPCFGVEFRFRLKTTVYQYFELDYVRIDGMLHNYSWIDSFTTKG